MRSELLDHGYIGLVESWGSDERIVEAARMSTSKGFLGWEPGPCEACVGTPGIEVVSRRVWQQLPEIGIDMSGRLRIDTPGISRLEDVTQPCSVCNGSGQLRGDAKLLSFLYGNKHATPFEMAGMVCDVQAPIMVFREWHRHRTQSYNEMSARYTPLPHLDYLPTVDRCLLSGGKNRQATGTGAELTSDSAAEWLDVLAAHQEASEAVYQDGLRRGVPKELARGAVTVFRYSRMRAQSLLRNWLAFLTLRQAPQAQWEIRQYADAVGRIIASLFPRTWGLFTA